MVFHTSIALQRECIVLQSLWFVYGKTTAYFLSMLLCPGTIPIEAFSIGDRRRSFDVESAKDLFDSCLDSTPLQLAIESTIT
jgi:hypothetical protein